MRRMSERGGNRAGSICSHQRRCYLRYGRRGSAEITRYLLSLRCVLRVSLSGAKQKKGWRCCVCSDVPLASMRRHSRESRVGKSGRVTDRPSAAICSRQGGRACRGIYHRRFGNCFDIYMTRKGKETTAFHLPSIAENQLSQRQT